MSGVILGVRVDEEIKNKLDNYCKSRGLKKGFFLSQIIEEKLTELIEDERDIILASQRIDSLEQDGISTIDELDTLIKKRLGKS